MESSFKEDAIMKWKTTAENLLQLYNDEKYKNRYNEDVQQAFSNFKKLFLKLIRNTKNIVISFNYATFATSVHPNVKAQADELCDIVRKQFPNASISVSFWGAKELCNSILSQPTQDFYLQITENPINIGNKKDFIALVNIYTYYKFITDDKEELQKYIFDSNVRDYQGKNTVNKEIYDTLCSNSEEDFWWFNNGVTIIADEIEFITSKELKLSRPSIVNGLQTSTEIYNFFKNNQSIRENEKRNILIRVIRPGNEKSRDNIIFATNNQTSIPKSSLRANDPTHLQIELYFKERGLYYDRRKNYYKNQGKSSSEIISVSFLAQCMISIFLQKPDYARARPSTLLSNEDIYKKLYAQNIDIEVFYKAAYIGKKVTSSLKNYKNIHKDNAMT